MALIPRQRLGCRLDELDGDFFLYHPEGDAMVACSAQAALIWSLCDGTRDGGDIVTLLRDAWPGAAERIARDVDATLAALLDAGFVTDG